MNNKRKNRIDTKNLLILLTILCISALALTLTDYVSITPLRRAASVVVVPFQKGVNAIGTWFTNQRVSFRDVQELSEEVAGLQAQVNALTEENTRLSLEQDELKRLRALYEIDNDYREYEKVPASVISKDPGSWYATFIIDKGSDDGVAVNMNVISGGGLVGIITETGRNWATVRSIMDDNSHVSAMTVTNYDTCIVSGDMTLINEGLLSFEQMNTENEIHPGERIVTSNISDKYLKGIPIGTVYEVSDDSNNLTKTGKIIPTVDFRYVQEVLVIKELKKTAS